MPAERISDIGVCGHTEEVKLILGELQRESRELAQSYEQAEQEMEALRKVLSELMDAKIAFEARERQVRKLSKQL
ncbi:hypothetical protein lerEdw1_015246 [Lerista edwardsae]|nr:hypothetical protein lerEdw1_015248 [Lerista edwardsae]KAJ6609194.1 hypothetical protein lerEdw1_015246 [Lerista edwardsae]